jgi:hypothetical protein
MFCMNIEINIFNHKFRFALFRFEAKITQVKRSEKFEAKISEKKRKKRSDIL